MSSDIEKKIVEIEFQNRNFEKGIKQSQKSIKELNESLKFKDADKSIKEVQKSLDSMKLDDLSSSVQKISDRFSALGVVGTTALMRITNAALTTGKNLVKSFTIDPLSSGLSEYETQINSVQTILANTKSKGTTLEDVTAVLDDLNKYADQTIYNYSQMTENMGKFTAAGVDIVPAEKAIMGIANLAALTGTNAQDASRAMYQLSQAISSGRVALQDWNSLVTAGGMSGEIFQKELRKMSEALGTGAEAAIEAKGNFRLSLETGWLTSEVLTETLNKFTKSGANEWVAEYTGLTKEAVEETLKAAEAQYGEAAAIEEASKQLAEKSGKNQQEIQDTLELAKTAEDAATKVKTFTQLMGTLKEAVQSGWSETWETVIGDFEEAKELFTGIKDAIDPVIAKSAELRNNMLKVWKALGGRTKLLEGLANIGRSILDIWSAISEAFHDVFGVTGRGLYEATKKFAEFTKELVVNEQTMEDVKRVVRGLASILNVFTQIISAVIKAIVSVAVYLKPLLTYVLHFFAVLGDGITILNYILKQTQIFNRLGMATARTLLLIGQIIENLLKLVAIGGIIVVKAVFMIGQTIAELYSTVNKEFGGIGGLILKVLGILGKKFPAFGKILEDLEPVITDFGRNMGAFFGSIKSAFGGVLGTIKGFASAFSGALVEFFGQIAEMDSISFSGLKNAFKTAGQLFVELLEKSGVDLTALKNAFKSFGDIVSKIFNIILDVAEPVLSTLIDMVNKLFSIITDKSVLAIVLLSLLVGSIFKLIKDLAGTFTGFTKSLTDGVTKVSNSISGYFDAMAKNEKSKAIKNLATSIAIMAGSLIMLTFVDQEKLKSSAIILGIFAAGMIVFMTAANAFTGWLAKSGKITQVGMGGFAGALLSLAFSMILVIKAVSNMQEEMNKAQHDGDTSFVEAMWHLIGAFSALSILATVLSVVTSKFAPNASKVAIAYVIQLFAVVSALKKLSDPSLDLGKGVRGLIAVGAFLLAFLGVERIASKISSGKGNWKDMIASALALRLVLNTMLKINKIPTDTIFRALGKSLLVIMAFRSVINSSRKAGSNDSSKAIRAVALAFLGLVLAMKILSKLNVLQIKRGTQGVFALLLPMTGLMLISKIGSKKIDASTKTILAMSGAIAAMSLCAALLSLIDPDGLFRGTVAVSVMGAVMGGIIALTRFVNKAKNGIKTISTIAVIIGVLAISAAILGKIDTDRLIASFAGIATVLGIMSVIFLSLKNVKATAALALVSMIFPIAAIGVAMAVLAKMDVNSCIETAIGFSVLILTLSLCAVLLGLLPLPAMLTGCLGLVAVSVALLAVLGAFGAVIGSMGDGSVFVTGAQVIGDIIGAIANGIISGIGDAATNVLPGLGAALTRFMDNMQGFIAGSQNLKNVDYGPLFGLAGLVGTLGIASLGAGGVYLIGEALDVFGTGLNNFVAATEGLDATKLDTVTLLFAGVGNMLVGLTSFSSETLTSFGEGLPTLAKNIVAFSAALLGEDGGSAISISTATEAAKIFAAFAAVAASVPRSGGLIGAVMGEANLGAFVEAMGQAGPAIRTFHDQVIGLQYENVAGALAILKETALTAHEIPNSGGLLGVLAGENNLDSFTYMMKMAGPDIKQFVTDVAGVSYDDAKGALAVLKETALTAQQIPNTGGLLAGLAGENKLDEFTYMMRMAGPDIKQFAGELKGVQVSDAKEALAILTATISAARSIPNEGGVVSWFTGDNSLSAFAKEMASAGPDIKTFIESMTFDAEPTGDAAGAIKDSTDVYENASKAVTVLGDFVNIISKFKGLGDATLPDMTNDTGTTAIYSLLTGMATAVKDTTSQTSMTAIGEAIIKMFRASLYPDGSEWSAYFFIQSFGDKLASCVDKDKDFYEVIGEDIVNDVSLAFEGDKMDKAAEKFSNGLINAVEKHLGIESPSKKFQEIGVYIVSGLSLGLQNGNKDIQKSADNMASTLENQFRDDMGIHSPSTLFSDLGTYIVDGLKNGLSSGGSMQDIISSVLGGVDFGSIFGDYGKDIADIFSGTIGGIDFSDFSLEGLDDGSFVDSLMAKIQDEMDDQGLTADITAVFDADAMQEQIDSLTGTLNTSGTGGVASATMDSFENTKFEDSQGSESSGKNSFSFVQNNYSPTALDRIVIYRQTRNQFAAMKEAINRV